MRSSVEPIRAAFIAWTRAHSAHWPLHFIVFNDEFSRFGDHDTDTAWMGFEAACKLRPKLKPLSWTLDRRAHTIVGTYIVMHSGDEPDEWVWWLRSDQNGTMRRACLTEGAAMAACETHYASLLAAAFEGSMP